MSREQQPFFEEIFQVSEIDCKDNDFFHLEPPYCSIDVISDVGVNQWTDAEKGMLTKIIELCGESIKHCRKIHLQTGDELSASIRNSDTKYILAFIDESYLKQIHFTVAKHKWTEINGTKLFVNQSLSEFANDTTAKQKLWKAMQQEFTKAKEYNE